MVRCQKANLLPRLRPALRPRSTSSKRLCKDLNPVTFRSTGRSNCSRAASELSESCRKQLEEAETRIETLIRKEATSSPSPSVPINVSSRRSRHRQAKLTRRSTGIRCHPISRRPKPFIGHALQPVRGRQAYPPDLCLAGAAAVAVTRAGGVTAACALELIHTYSLIHDDLPALDNDDFRRGKLTCHKVFGEAMAILAGDALLTLAFQMLSKIEGLRGRNAGRTDRGAGYGFGHVGGMIGGQVTDMEGEGKPPDARLLERFIAPRPARCFAPACAWAAFCEQAKINWMRSPAYGEHMAWR